MGGCSDHSTITRCHVNAFPMITLHRRPYVFGEKCRWRRFEHGVHIQCIQRVSHTHANGQAVYYHTAVALDTNMALVCGWNGLAALSACFSYAATEDVWSPAAQLIAACFGHGIVVYKGLF
jgi:hypothetical protein